MFDVVALGEVLIDFTPQGVSERGNPLFERNPGGAPANVLACLAKLGKETAFIGKVGRDQFGTFLKQTLEENGIHTGGLVFDGQVNTTLAFVHLQPDGDRSFSFYRNPGADMNLHPEEVDFDLVRNTRIFHFGSLSLTGEPVRFTTFEALKVARDAGVLVSYDPNLREPLWESLDLAKEMIGKGMAYADVVKISEEELTFLTGLEDLEEGSKALMASFGNIRLLLVTLGPKGSYYRTADLSGEVPGFMVKAVDTTGAGDSFLGGILHGLLERDLDLDSMGEQDFLNLLLFANAGASIVTTRYGAIAVMPTMEEIQARL
ncbi:PfkB family carbohydrate kinase [Anaerotalea alkaliphila]|uniref:Carbohydrate kinase n=1 Tax=Anaerotalea alkaliphila TaxID=2662126 RepID=A0A7X5HX77_9FIRM|nr:PfkB family carbohydrate kinase [Anaerotalea alkaliphila]NDL68338.1 carbohydrate kinase [Anaerotalea alkaliphila]